MLNLAQIICLLLLGNLAIANGNPARQHAKPSIVREAVRSGALTRDELNTLRNERQALHQKAQTLRDDGLTEAEKAELKSERSKLKAHTETLINNDVRQSPPHGHSGS